MKKRDYILKEARDLMSMFLYYDRKEDKNLQWGEIEHSILNNEITVDEIISVFKDEIESSVKST